MRVLIDKVNACPTELLMLISPQTIAIQRWIKLPMVMLVICSSMMSSTSMVMLKMLGELV